LKADDDEGDSIGEWFRGAADMGLKDRSFGMSGLMHMALSPTAPPAVSKMGESSVSDSSGQPR
jgi:hypothetical protein